MPNQPPKPQPFKKRFLLVLLFIAVLTTSYSQDMVMANFSLNMGTESILKSTLKSHFNTTFSKGLELTGLDKVLEQAGPFTVFAPSDKAFSRMDPKELKALFLPENRNKLRALLAFHMVAGEFTAAKILKALCQGEGKTAFRTVEGTKVTATMDGVDIVLTDSMGHHARIVKADMAESNGVVHMVDNVVMPKP